MEYNFVCLVLENEYFNWTKTNIGNKNQLMWNTISSLCFIYFSSIIHIRKFSILFLSMRSHWPIKTRTLYKFDECIQRSLAPTTHIGIFSGRQVNIKFQYKFTVFQRRGKKMEDAKMRILNVCINAELNCLGIVFIGSDIFSSRSFFLAQQQK